MTAAASDAMGVMDDRQVAWELHVELATRVAVAPLPRGQGLSSEALASLEVLLARARRLLSAHGPHEIDNAACAFRVAAGQLVDEIIGPFLLRWKPRLAAAQVPTAGPFDQEQAWPLGDEFRDELDELRQRVARMAGELAGLAGCHSLIPGQEGTR